LIQIVPQGVALDVLHRYVGVLVFFAVLIYRNDARVQQAAGGLGFVAKARREIRRSATVEKIPPDGLECHRATDDGVKRLVNNPHGPFAHQTQERVFAEQLRRQLLVRDYGLGIYRELLDFGR